LHAIHVTSFRDADRSRDFAEGLRAQTGESVRILPSETDTGRWYRVLLGQYESREVAIDRIAVLRQHQDATFMRPVRLAHSDEEQRAAKTP